MRSTFLCLSVILFSALSAGCGEKNRAETIELRVGKDLYTVEIARTPEERQKGLMNRESLGEFTGMLFVFDRDQKLSFWMKDTLVPLSIAYMSKEGTIREIHHMQPLSTRPVESGHSVRFALELAQGAFARSGVKVGDRIDLSALEK